MLHLVYFSTFCAHILINLMKLPNGKNTFYSYKKELHIRDIVFIICINKLTMYEKYE